MGLKVGDVPLFQSNTMSPGSRPTSVPSGILIHPAVRPQQTWAKIAGKWVFLEGGAVFQSNTLWHGPEVYPYQVASLSIQPKIGGGYCAPFGGGEVGPYLAQCRQGQDLPPYKVAS